MVSWLHPSRVEGGSSLGAFLGPQIEDLEVPLLNEAAPWTHLGLSGGSPLLFIQTGSQGSLEAVCRLPAEGQPAVCLPQSRALGMRSGGTNAY